MAKSSTDITDVPLPNAGLASAPIRQNFDAIKQALQTLESAPGGGGGSAKALFMARNAAHNATGGYPPPSPATSASNGLLLVDEDTVILYVWYDTAWTPVN